MSEDLSRLEDLFTAARELPVAERAAWLERACGNDAALRQRVEALLAAEEKADDTFLRPPERPEIRVEGPGDRIGPYLIQEKLGEGGVGLVFLAEQAEPVRRRVALKVIKPGMDSREVIARFEAERQALALMDHPSIARVYDAGVTETGRPYFAMEFVAGEPITTFCDRQALGLEERLELFIGVCRAVQHAHAKGVIHRDLKPSNVLVQRVDGAPVAKVIDFGIAKAIETPLTGEALTLVAHFLGTPAYMSPEQADGGGAAVDTRSDVYSLGVLLYELLTGRTPFAPRELVQAGLEEMRRRIRQEEPPRPSTLLAALDQPTLQASARARSVEPVRLVAQLRSDLDWVVLRCLEKDPARRYSTVSALAEDLRRHLQHEPVTAVAPTAWYTLTKFARRYRRVFIGGLVGAIVLVLAAAISTWQAVRATRAERLAAERAAAEAAARSVAEAERAKAESAERKAQQEAATSAAISRFLREDLLAQASPNQQRNRDLKLREAVDAAAQRLAGKFSAQPLVEAAVRETLGETYQALGEFPAMLAQLEAARALALQHAGADDEATLRISGRLVLGLRQVGRLAEAETLGRDTRERAARVLGETAPLAVQMTSLLPTLLMAQGKSAEAQPQLQEALELSRRALGPEHASTLTVMSNLAGVAIELGQLDEAARWGEETLTLRRRVLGADHPQSLLTAANLAETYARRGELERAAKLSGEVYATRLRVLGPEHPGTLSIANQAASLAFRRGDAPGAERIYRQTLEAQQRKFAPGAVELLATREALADALVAQARWDEALEIIGQARAAAAPTLGEEHVEVLGLLAVQVRACIGAGRWAEADEAAERLMNAAARRDFASVPNVADWRAAVAGLRDAQGRRAEAIELYRAAWIQRREFAPLAPETLTLGEALAAAQETAGETASAREVWREVAAGWAKVPGESARADRARAAATGRR